MKSFTDIEQSKKLADILPIESADMRYAPFGDTHPWFIEGNLIEADAVPCWSLAALLEYLKQCYYVRLSHDGVSWGITCFEHDTKKEYNLYMFDEPVDACWGMILRLNKEGVL